MTYEVVYDIVYDIVGASGNNGPKTYDIIGKNLRYRIHIVGFDLLSIIHYLIIWHLSDPAPAIASGNSDDNQDQDWKSNDQRDYDIIHDIPCTWSILLIMCCAL